MWFGTFKKAHFILCLAWLNFVPALNAGRFAASLKKFRQNNNNNICLNHADGDFVEHPDNCRLFYLCKVDDQAVVGSCPPMMLFNPDSKLCDKATNVRCRSSGLVGSSTTTTITTSGITVTATATTASATSSSYDLADAMRYCAAFAPQQQQDNDLLNFIGSSTSCRRYYICYYGQALLQECSENLYWNANVGKCDRPANVNCRLGQNGNDSNTNGNGNSNGNGNNNNNGINNVNIGNDLDSDQFINCPNYGQHIYPHLRRCDLFIYCVKGHATLQQCPFYYHFDIVTKSCKWRKTAVCVRDLNVNFQKTTNS